MGNEAKLIDVFACMNSVKNFSPRKSAALAALSLAALLPAVAFTATTGGSASAASLPDCGISPSTTYATCAFHDDFSGGADGATIDNEKWTVVAAGPYTTMPDKNCLQAENVTVSGGQVHLTSKVLKTSILCQRFGGATLTRNVGATINNDVKFSHKYGLVEMRVKYPVANQYSHTALWMMPDENTYGEWPMSGEVDISERMPQAGEPVYASLHYYDASGSKKYNILSGDGAPGESYLCQPDTPNEFHTYGFEWNPTSVTFSIDGVPCKTTGWDPHSSQPDSAPFDQPFHEILTQVGLGTNAGTYTTDVDWVKVWTN